MKLLTALEHHSAGRLNEAVQIYQHILQADPDNADVLHLCGNAACQQGDADSSILLLSRASALSPSNTIYLISLGMAFRIKGQYNQAMACYFKVLDIDPRAASAYFGLGNTQQAIGNVKDAAICFTKALEINPRLIEARYNLANLQKTSGQYTNAIENYQKVIIEKPDFADAYHNMGGALQALGKLDEALESYEHALLRNLPETHNNIGNINFDKGRLETALISYKRAIDIKPDYAIAHNNIGNTLCQLGRLQEAVASFEAAIRILPNYAVAHFNLGNLLMARDFVNEAERHYQMAIAIEPEMTEAYFNLGVVKSKQNELQAARMCFERTVAYRHDYINAIYNLGCINGRLMLPAEAERCYRKVLTLNPDHVDAHINLSAILMEDGRLLEAKNHMDLAYSHKNLFVKRSKSANKSVLILFDAGKGNVNLTHLFNEKTNNIIDWMIEYASEDQFDNLPKYDVVFNAMGDSDLTGDIRGQVNRFVGQCQKTILNHPNKVALTARNILPNLIAGTDQLLVPPVWRFSRGDTWDKTAMERLPLLIRPVHTHGGIGMILAETKPEVERFKASQSGPVYVSHYIDYRSADTWFRKYRIIFIDRKPYPYHLAISQKWMVHYLTAEMENFPWKLEEENYFLQYPEKVLGPTGYEAIKLLGTKMDLDYAGLDFSIMPDGRILVFEANPTMLVHPENDAGPLAFKNAYVRRIFDAFERLLHQSIH